MSEPDYRGVRATGCQSLLLLLLALLLTACASTNEDRYAWQSCHESGTYTQVLPAHVRFYRRMIQPYLSFVLFDEYSYRDEIDAAKAQQYRNELVCFKGHRDYPAAMAAIEAKDWGKVRRLIKGMGA